MSINKLDKEGLIAKNVTTDGILIGDKTIQTVIGESIQTLNGDSICAAIIPDWTTTVYTDVTNTTASSPFTVTMPYHAYVWCYGRYTSINSTYTISINGSSIQTLRYGSGASQHGMHLLLKKGDVLSIYCESIGWGGVTYWKLSGASEE